MDDDEAVAIYVRPCGGCGQQTVTSSLCLRPDLCPRCFAEIVAPSLT